MTLRILHLEDNPDDACLVGEFLASQGLPASVEVVARADDYLAALMRGGFDLIVSDTSIPGLGVERALQAARHAGVQVPFIVLSGADDVGKNAHNGGADGAFAYLSKQELPSFLDAVRRSVQLPICQPQSEFSYTRAMESLVIAIQRLSLARDLDSVMKIVRSAAREICAADGATFVLRRGDSCYYADEDAIGPLWKGMQFPMTACVSGWAMLHREPAICADIYRDPRIPLDAYEPTFVRSLVMVPIRREAPIGAIGTYWARPHLASAEEVKVLQLLADSTSLTLENVQLYSELEKRVQERTAQYETANKELESFAYSVSHDLRAPLRSIAGFSQMLAQRALGLEEKSQDYLQRILSAAQRMGELIDDLLSLSRIGRAPVKVEEVDLGRLAHDIAQRLEKDSPQRQALWSIQTPLVVRADAGLMAILLENLLGNAWKFSSKRESTHITLGVTDDGLTFFVRDNGAGFDPAYADKLFGAFQRLHDETEFPGTGIGLATVARIVHRHGGAIWVESQVNHGTTFYFTLPASPV